MRNKRSRSTFRVYSSLGIIIYQTGAFFVIVYPTICETNALDNHLGMIRYQTGFVCPKISEIKPQ
eukprot:Pgem_evm1s15600